MKLKHVTLHEAGFIIGVGQVGPKLGEGATNSTTNQSADLTFHETTGLLEVRINNKSMFTPASNIKYMNAVDLSPIAVKK